MIKIDGQIAENVQSSIEHSKLKLIVNERYKIIATVTIQKVNLWTHKIDFLYVIRTIYNTLCIWTKYDFVKFAGWFLFALI